MSEFDKYTAEFDAEWRPQTASTLEDLLALEAIRAVTTRYLRAADMRDWRSMRDTFSDDDFVLHHALRGHVLGGDAVAAKIESDLQPVTTVHHLHDPEICLSNDTALGYWNLQSIVSPKDKSAEAAVRFSLYRNRAKKVNGEWKLTAVHLTYLVETSIQQ